MLLPEQIVVVPVMLTEGGGLTVTVAVALPVHPLEPVPVTVYVVVDAGVTVMLAPLRFPGIQLYVLPPDALSVVVPPVQMVALPLVVTTGDGLTVMVIVEVFVQLPFAPVTVYVVVAAGVTITEAPVRLPGIQV